MSLSIIVAVGANLVIGKNNSLIWHLPEDMKYFKEKTLDHCIITGRKNYESIPAKYRPLVNRTNIVVTRQKNYVAPGAIITSSLEEAIAIAKEKCKNEIFIIGGGDIFKQSLSLVDTIYLTKIEHPFEGDVFFPEINLKEWKLISHIEGKRNEKNNYDYSFNVYKRIK